MLGGVATVLVIMLSNWFKKEVSIEIDEMGGRFVCFWSVILCK